MNRLAAVVLAWILAGPIPARVDLVMVAAVVRAPQAFELVASWYGPRFEGKPTASGEAFDSQKLTAAHRTLPMGSILLVEFQGRRVEVRVNDRGPFIHGRDIDLSQGAATVLGIIGAGVGTVKVRRLA